MNKKYFSKEDVNLGSCPISASTGNMLVFPIYNEYIQFVLFNAVSAVPGLLFQGCQGLGLSPAEQ